MAERQMTTPVTGPEHERRDARRVATPFVIAAAVIALVIAAVFGVTQPWEGSDTTQRDAPPIASPTAAP
jgi:hypothetical protein